MKTTFKSLATIACSLALIGCAGVNFKRPDPSSLKLGKTTTAEVVAVMGPPARTSETTKNTHLMKNLSYSYAETAITAARTDVITARGITLSTFNDILVSQQFRSTFKEDTTDFDETKVPQIIKGKTTRSEVIALLGNPSGEAIYPIIKTPGEVAVKYSYIQVRRPLFVGPLIIYSKDLTLSLDSFNVVSDIELTISGEK
jgi:outer membrane protein assembly factor BamE (lipoprotein component of BamABCDE complex)